MHKYLFLLVFLVSISYIQDVYAKSYEEDPIGITLCTLSWGVRHKVTKAIAIIGVIGFALLTLRGKISWQYSLMIICGIVIIMQTDEILRFLNKITVIDFGKDQYVCTGRI
ncbi:MAG TPA: TrbC/VirB2 family protein [Rickettsia endosymbiont of Bembidion nr. Transversale]|nr:TrbC/VirB2 family protein [Rickettsia endosymbiont of Bembidion nr. Transversale]